MTSNVEHPDIEEVSHYCMNFIIDLPLTEEMRIQEISEEEMLILPEKIGIFSFLEDDAENIYGESDGVPL